MNTTEETFRVSNDQDFAGLGHQMATMTAVVKELTSCVIMTLKNPNPAPTTSSDPGELSSLVTSLGGSHFPNSTARNMRMLVNGLMRLTNRSGNGAAGRPRSRVMKKMRVLSPIYPRSVADQPILSP